MTDRKPKSGFEYILKRIFKSVLIIIFLPFYLILGLLRLFQRYLLKKSDASRLSRFKNYLIKSLGLIVLFLISTPLWFVGVVLPLLFLFNAIAGSFIPLSYHKVEGRSMLPTFNQEEVIRMYKRIDKPKIGDIVIFNNSKTVHDGSNVDFIKRVIGVSGDTLEIKNGYLYRNGIKAIEPYLFNPRSTNGNDFLKDCASITIPEDMVFLMGDNRNRSEDSRKLGLVSVRDIVDILPYDKEGKYTSRWLKQTDPKDNGFTIDKDKLFNLLNTYRADSKLKPLKNNQKLEIIAQRRAKFIIDQLDKNIPIEQVANTLNLDVSVARYFNRKFTEQNFVGFYEEDVILDVLKKSKPENTLLNPDYNEIGIALFIGSVQGCNKQIIVQEFGE